MISAAVVFALNLDLQIQAFKFVTWNSKLLMVTSGVEGVVETVVEFYRVL